jgi:G3E family GTPase
VLRSKGLFWIATRPDLIGLWSQAGGTGNVRWAGRWYAAMPKEEWPEDEEEYQRVQGVWDPEYGDRSQELVLIGRRMDQAALTARLNACLLTEDEWASGRSSWEGESDPFPPMELPTETDAGVLSATPEER